MSKIYSDDLLGVAEALIGIKALDRTLESTQVIIAGKIEIRSQHNYRIGYVSWDEESYSWVFEPDYSE